MPINTRDHAAWLSHWADQLVAAITSAVAHPPVGEDFRLQWAVHCARIAHSRAVKARPSLKKFV